jgi:hypothetical protein
VLDELVHLLGRQLLAPTPPMALLRATLALLLRLRAPLLPITWRIARRRLVRVRRVLVQLLHQLRDARLEDRDPVRLLRDLRVLHGELSLELGESVAA